MTVAINQITARSINEALKHWEQGRSTVESESLIRDSAYILSKLLAENGVLQQVHEAIHNKGPNPAFQLVPTRLRADHHVAMLEKHRAAWPTLWGALESLDSVLQDVDGDSVRVG